MGWGSIGELILSALVDAARLSTKGGVGFQEEGGENLSAGQNSAMGFPLDVPRLLPNGLFRTSISEGGYLKTIQGPEARPADPLLRKEIPLIDVSHGIEIGSES